MIPTVNLEADACACALCGEPADMIVADVTGETAAVCEVCDWLLSPLELERKPCRRAP